MLRWVWQYGSMPSTQRRRRQFDPERLTTLAYFDADAANRYAPIAKRTFYAAIAEGKLRAFRIGGNGKLVVRREDLERFLSATPAENNIARLVDETMRELGTAGRRGRC